MTGTFACPECGLDTPHGHDPDEVLRNRLERHLIRPAFEREYGAFCRGGRFDRERAPLVVSGHANPAYSYRRMAHGTYLDEKVEALWQFWKLAWDTAKEQK